VTASVNGASASYVYDGLGQRVMKFVCPGAGPCTGASQGVVQTTYVYDAFGNLAAEYGPSEASPCGTANPTPCYVSVDHLGSTRMLMDSTGTVQRRYDYLPFGTELLSGTDGRSTGYLSSPDDVGPKFTSKERDAETGLDFFNARYFSSAQGRFSSADPAGIFLADPRNPQTWNLYTYGLNNPLVNIDPSGLTCVTVTHPDGSSNQADNGDGQGCKDAQVAPTKDQKPPADASDVAPQQFNVSAQQGSLWAFLSAPPVPRYVPNDTPLDAKGQIVTHELSKRIDNYPTVCGGGVYLYLGKEFDVGAANAFAGTIMEYDSREGSSKGALFEAGGGEGLVGGAGYAATTSGGQLAGTGLGYAGVGVHSAIGAASAGVVGFGSGGNVSGAGVYGEGFLFGRGGGVGAYLNLTNVGKCRQ